MDIMNMNFKKVALIATLASLIFSGLMFPIQAQASTSVVIDSGSKILKPSNTSRKVAVSPSGDIFALYTGATGHHVAKYDAGTSVWSTSSATVSPLAEAELAASSNGRLFVTWLESGSIKQISSTNDGATWSSEVTVGSASGTSVHTAVDREYVYVIPRNGQKVFSSSDNGATYGEAPLSARSWAFSDIAVDPLSGVIYPFVDNPSVSFYESSDRGLTFSTERSTGKSVFFSVAALAANSTNRFLYMAGSGSNLERLNLATNAVDSLVVSSVTSATSRTLAADGFGNVVSAGISSGALSFEVSQNSGATFTTTAVATGLGSSDYGTVSINPTNGDVLVMYSKNGDVIFDTFPGLLNGYALNLDVTYVDFDTSGTRTVVLTNTGGSSLTIGTVELSNLVFSQSTTCGGALASGSSCSVTIVASTQGAAILRVVASGGIERLIPVAFGASSATVVSPTLAAPVVASAVEEFVGYEGPEFDNPGAKSHLAGNDMLIVGKRLDTIKSMSILGSTVSFRAVSATEMVLSIPASLEQGIYDVSVTSPQGVLIHLRAVNVKAKLLPQSMTIKSSRVFTGEDFQVLTAFARAQDTRMVEATCVVNSNSRGRSFMQARLLCERIAMANPNIRVTMFESRSTVKNAQVYARVTFASGE